MATVPFSLPITSATKLPNEPPEKRGVLDTCHGFYPFPLLMAILLLALHGVSWGRTLTVAVDGTADYATIERALNAAVSGDTVQVGSGTYRESVGLKSGVVLLGSGYQGTRIEVEDRENAIYAVGVSETEVVGFTLAYTGTEGWVTVGVNSGQVRFTECRVINSTATGILAVEGSDVIIAECRVEQTGARGIVFKGGTRGEIRNSEIRRNLYAGMSFTEGSSGEVVGNTISGNDGYGVEVNGAGPVRIVGNEIGDNTWAGILGKEEGDLEVRGNTLVDNETYGVLLQSGSTATVVDNVVAMNRVGGINSEEGSIIQIGFNDVWNNDVWNNGARDYEGIPVPSSDLAVDPRFENFEKGDYRLQSATPLIGAASEGGIIGALGVAEGEPAVPVPECGSPSDFDGSGEVGFEDFFLFADALGGADPRFDLDSSGTVDLSDFFSFADDFGKVFQRRDPNALVRVSFFYDENLNGRREADEIALTDLNATAFGYCQRKSDGSINIPRNQTTTIRVSGVSPNGKSLISATYQEPTVVISLPEFGYSAGTQDASIGLADGFLTSPFEPSRINWEDYDAALSDATNWRLGIYHIFPEKWSYPANYFYYGYRIPSGGLEGRAHLAFDIWAVPGTPVLASAPGRIVEPIYDYKFGINGAYGTVYYNHLVAAVSIGETVDRYDVVGYIDEDRHLHHVLKPGPERILEAFSGVGESYFIRSPLDGEPVPVPPFWGPQ